MLVESRAFPPGWTLRLRSRQAREMPVAPLYDFEGTTTWNNRR